MPALPTIPAELTALVSDFQGNLEFFKGQVKEAFSTLDITTVAAILLVLAGVIIVYDLMVYVLASATTARSMMLSPFLAKVASEAWERRDEFGLSNMIESRSSSIDDFHPILEAMTLAAEKYDQEELALQSTDKHEKLE